MEEGMQFKKKNGQLFGNHYWRIWSRNRKIKEIKSLINANVLLSIFEIVWLLFMHSLAAEFEKIGQQK